MFALARLLSSREVAGTIEARERARGVDKAGAGELVLRAMGRFPRDARVQQHAARFLALAVPGGRLGEGSGVTSAGPAKGGAGWDPRGGKAPPVGSAEAEAEARRRTLLAWREEPRGGLSAAGEGSVPGRGRARVGGSSDGGVVVWSALGLVSSALREHSSHPSVVQPACVALLSLLSSHSGRVRHSRAKAAVAAGAREGIAAVREGTLGARDADVGEALAACEAALEAADREDGGGDGGSMAGGGADLLSRLLADGGDEDS